MLKTSLLLLILIVLAGCQASGGGAAAGGIITGHVEVKNEFTLSTQLNTNYATGQSMSFTLTFPVDVVVIGTPKLAVTIGSTTVDADFTSSSGKNLYFEYNVQAGDVDENGITVSTTLNYNGGTCKFQTTSDCSTKIVVPLLNTVKVNSSLGDVAPVAANITPSDFNEEASSTITLSYTDSNGDLATSCSLSALNKVSVSTACACAAGVCTVGVTGDANQNGAAGFSYTVTANGQTSNTATASFTLTAVADAPVANAITPAAFNEDTSSTITLSYTDAEGDLATSCSVSSLSKVTVSTACACAAGVCTVGVTGTANQNGAAGFDYTVTANGQTSNSASASFTLTPVADAPVAANITPASFNEDTQSVITLSYTDADGDLATACAISSPTNVTVTQACACASGTCTVGVTGTSNYAGAASFSYTVTANAQTSNSATATLTITSVNDAPVAANITPAAFNEDVQSVITLSYTDTESDLATSCAISGLSNVTVTQACACSSGTCTVGVTGTSNYNGSAAFNYTVTAGSQTSNSATATLSITAVDDAPVAANITPASFAKNTQSVITLSYSDVESHQASTCSVSGLSNVTETQACACAGGVCTVGVTGTSNYAGSASFNYTVTANGLGSNSASASLTITSSAPVASNITPAAFNEDTQSVITLSYTDADSDQAVSCAVSSPSNVTVTQACACAAGVCTVGVTGTANHNGSASFAYTVSDSGATSNSATATLSITAVDDAPVANNLTPAAFNEDVQSTITLSYTDVEGDFAASCSVSGLSNVTVTTPCSCTLGTCTVGVTGTANYNGTAGFNYTVTANSQTSNSASASLTLSSVLDAPSVANITPSAFDEETQSVITLSYTNNGDAAVSCSTSALTNVTVTEACACAGGVCTVGVTGTSDYAGPASFDFQVSAGTGADSNTATANLTINNTDDAASLGAIATQSTSVSTVTSAIAFTFNDTDGAVCTSARLSMTSSDTSVVSNGSVTWAGSAPNCTATITPVSNKAGSVTITITATDGGLANKTTNFTLNVNGAVLVWTDTSGNVLTSYDFGTPGANTTYAVRVRNDGNQTSGAITITDPGNTPRIGVSATSCAALAAGGFCSLNLTWTNTGGGGSGLKTETITATHADGSSSAAIAVQGTK